MEGDLEGIQDALDLAIFSKGAMEGEKEEVKLLEVIFGKSCLGVKNGEGLGVFWREGEGGIWVEEPLSSFGDFNE